MLVLFFFIIGLFIGSFLNVVVDRLENGESIMFGRSHCEYCKKTLQWYDLIPLVSFGFYRATCRYCHHKLSYYYPIVEFVTGFFFASTIFWLQSHFSVGTFLFATYAAYYLFIVAVLLIVFFIDLKYGIIPLYVVLATSAIVLLFAGIGSPSSVVNLLLSGIGASLFFLLLFIGTKGRGMGFGDVVFAFLMGVLLGYPAIILAIYLAFLTGAGISLILILWGKKKLSGGTIPFGPFLVAGTYLCLLWGEPLVKFALKLLNL